MPGSPEVVQTLPPSRPRTPASTPAGRPAESVAPSEAQSRSSSGISKVAWAPPTGVGQAEWLATGRKLGAIARSNQWWLGDWIRYGTARWGEKYAEAARVTGYDVASLRNMAWVASQFDLSLRSDKLSWSHHVLLTPLADEEKRSWLERAVDERLSVADLRLELRKRQAPRAVSEEAAGDDGDEVVVCPNCGHELHSPAS